MIDNRLKTLCASLVNYSMRVQKGEKVLIENFDCPPELSEQLIEEVVRAGGIPFHISRTQRITRALLMHATKEQIEAMTRFDAARMEEMDAYVAFRAATNTSELGDVGSDEIAMYDSIYAQKVHHEIRVKKSKWVVLRFPNKSIAQPPDNRVVPDRATRSREKLQRSIYAPRFPKLPVRHLRTLMDIVHSKALEDRASRPCRHPQRSGDAPVLPATLSKTPHPIYQKGLLETMQIADRGASSEIVSGSV